MEGALIDEAGVCLRVLGEYGGGQATLTVFVDDLYFDGQPDYSVELDRERMSRKTAANGGRCRKPMEIGIRSTFA